MKIQRRLSNNMIILQLLSSEAASLQKKRDMVAAVRQHDYMATVTAELHWDKRTAAAVHR